MLRFRTNGMSEMDIWYSQSPTPPPLHATFGPNVHGPEKCRLASGQIFPAYEMMCQTPTIDWYNIN